MRRRMSAGIVDTERDQQQAAPNAPPPGTLSTPVENLTVPPIENLTVRRGDEPQFVEAS